ncbi:hypothetical protein [Leifsonia sp. SIMBA_070]|uniref:hypothetical protein n=1 Tax=Leifsonia sp. SIMBA_070 TaxID=3085810 RepID=UPI0039781DEC
MNTNKATGADNNETIRDATETDAMRAAYADAKAAPCDFPECDGSWHEPGVEPDRWAHHADVEFDNGEVEVSIIRTGDEAPHASVWLEGIYEDMTADDLRRLAATYEALPALMRSQADKLEALGTEGR